MNSDSESPTPRSSTRVPAILLGIVVLALFVCCLWPKHSELRGLTAERPPAPPAAPDVPQLADSAPSARVEASRAIEALPAEIETPVELPVVGRVLDGDRELPLAGARIELADLVWASGTHEPRWKRETHSAADGTFAVESVPASQYWLSVRCEGFTRERIRIDVQEPPHSTVSEGASVSSGDIRLRRGVHLRIRATDAATQAAVAGASLYLFDGVMAIDRRALGFLGKTDARGELDVAERLSIRGEAATLLALGDDGMGTVSLASGDRLATEREFVVPIQPGAGFLVHVHDEHGAPLEGAKVHASTYAFPIGPLTLDSESILDLSGTNAEDGRLRDRFRCQTNPSGEARLHGLLTLDDPRGFRLSASLKGYSGEGLDQQQPERDPKPKEITLAPQTILTRLVGTVRAEDGSRLPTVTVRCGGRTTTADPMTGHYELSELNFSTIDSNRIQATAAGWANERTYFKSAGPDPCVQDLMLFRAGEIRGIVLDEAGAPVAGASVHFCPYVEVQPRGQGQSPAEPRATLTDGRFVIRDVRSGEYELHASSAEARSLFGTSTLPQLRFPIVIARTGDTEVRITGWRDCSMKGSIHANVVDARTRAPVDIASAALMPPGENFSVSQPNPATFTIHIGEIDIPSVPTGRWGLWVLATNGNVGFASFETTDAMPSTTVEVRVFEVATLTGRLVAAEGAAPPASWAGFRVLAVRHHDWIHPSGLLWGQRFQADARAIADANGRFEFPGLMPGRYTLQASDKNLHGMMTVEFLDPESKSVEFVLKPPAIATIAIEAPIELFDGLTMLRYWEGGEVQDDFPLKADVAGQNRRTIRLELGSFRIQASRRANASDTSEPKSFFFDESFELKADETRTLTLSAPR